MAGAPKRAPALSAPEGRLSLPPKPEPAKEGIGWSALISQRQILRADAPRYQARAPQAAKFAIASAVGTTEAAATALEAGRHPPVMVFAPVPAAVAVRHSHLALLGHVRTLHIVLAW
jgi:hypothetical protein